MKVEIRGAPAFCHLSVTLEPGETILSRGGAMADMEGSVSHRVRLRRNLLSGIFGALAAGETVFLNHFENNFRKPLQLTLSPPTPGHVEEVALDKPLYMQGRSFLACTQRVDLRLVWAGFRSWFSGEGFFHLCARPIGGGQIVWFSCYGSAQHHELKPGDTLLVDTTHLVAYQKGIFWRIGVAGNSLFSAFASGEGFLTRLTGTGRVTLQTRSLKNLARWCNRHF